MVLPEEMAMEASVKPRETFWSRSAAELAALAGNTVLFLVVVLVSGVVATLLR
jgi:hypothetical protein